MKKPNLCTDSAKLPWQTKVMAFARAMARLRVCLAKKMALPRTKSEGGPRRWRSGRWPLEDKVEDHQSLKFEDDPRPMRRFVPNFGHVMSCHVMSTLDDMFNIVQPSVLKSFFMFFSHLNVEAY